MDRRAALIRLLGAALIAARLLTFDLPAEARPARRADRPRPSPDDLRRRLAACGLTTAEIDERLAELTPAEVEALARNPGATGIAGCGERSVWWTLLSLAFLPVICLMVVPFSLLELARRATRNRRRRDPEPARTGAPDSVRAGVEASVRPTPQKRVDWRRRR